MLTCCVCGRRGRYPDLEAQSEQRSADGRGWDPLYGCTDSRACYARLMAQVDADSTTPRTALPASTAVQGA